MHTEFANLLRRLYLPGADLFGISTSIKAIKGHQAMLLDELERQVELDDAGKLLSLLWVISLTPSAIFTSTLCRLLEEKKGRYYLEAVIDAMHELADEDSVPCLRAALCRYEPWDQDFAFNRKILWALERIGTPLAMDIVRSAIANEHIRISETAEGILERNTARGKGSDVSPRPSQA